MKFLTNAIFALSVAVTAEPVAAREFCSARVVRSELLPFARAGSWLTTASLELKQPKVPPVSVTIREILPWHFAIREGEMFRIPCEQAAGDGLSLSSLASAPGYRSAVGPYARLR